MGRAYRQAGLVGYRTSESVRSALPAAAGYRYRCECGGAGVIINGLPVAGANHTEVGHIRIVRSPADDFAGVCPFHGDCLEGLAAGPAIAARAHGAPERLSAADPIWD